MTKWTSDEEVKKLIFPGLVTALINRATELSTTLIVSQSTTSRTRRVGAGWKISCVVFEVKLKLKIVDPDLTWLSLVGTKTQMAFVIQKICSML